MLKQLSETTLHEPLALLLCVDAVDRRVFNGRLILVAEEARGWLPSMVVWLRPPSDADRRVIEPTFGLRDVDELHAYSNP